MSLASVLALELADGTTSELGVWQDLAREYGYRVEVISDEEAEYRRVEWATGPEGEVIVFDGFPRPTRKARCGGLKAIEPSEGGDFKAWIKARVSRLWQRLGRQRMLFEYMTKRKFRDRDGHLIHNMVRKKQRWETNQYVDIGLDNDSPAHLSGFGSGTDGKTTVHGVSSPRVEKAPRTAPMHLTNRQFDFGRSA